MGDRGSRGPTVRGPKGQPGPPGLPGESILPFKSALCTFIQFLVSVIIPPVYTGQCKTWGTKATPPLFGYLVPAV